MHQSVKGRHVSAYIYIYIYIYIYFGINAFFFIGIVLMLFQNYDKIII